jgi:FkbM family methyltransferase
MNIPELIPPQNKTKKYWKKLLWRVISLPRREMTLKTKNGILTFNTRDRVLGKELFSAGHYEWNTIISLMETLDRHSLLKGPCMLDIGANIGMISIAFLGNGFFEKAIAFEPEPYNFQLLQRNVKQNNLASRIECQNMAISSQNGFLDLEIAEDNFGDHRVRPAKNVDPGFYREEKRKTHPVKVMRLDDFLANSDVRDSIGLIWVDIQGHEGHLLAGARNTIGKKVPLVCEFWPYAMNRAGTSKEQFLELAAELFTGYFHIQSGPSEWAPINTLHRLFDEYRQPREMGTVLFV